MDANSLSLAPLAIYSKGVLAYFRCLVMSHCMDDSYLLPSEIVCYV